VAGNIPDDTETWLVNLPPTLRQRRLAAGAAAALLVAFGVFAPFANTPLPRLDAFIPSFEATIFVTDFITSVLLFALFSIYHSRALLALASGYLFTALIIIPHALTFPGAFSPTGLLGAGLQSTAWLYIFWHIGFPAALLIYAWLKDEKRAGPVTPSSTLFPIGASVAIVFGLVCGLTWLAVARDEFLPRMFLDRTHLAPFATYINVLWMLICAFALAVLWIRRRSVLDQWLMIVLLSSILEVIFVSLLSNARFSLGFYAGRICSLIASTVVLVVLLAETTRMYARLARSNMMLQRERESKLMNVDAITSSIVHEMKQPLAAISANGSAGLRWLARTPPDADETRAALTRMVNESHRAGQVLESIRSLFRQAEDERQPVDANETALAALSILRDELKGHGIVTRAELAAELPPVLGHRGQLQQVILNLVHNAAEAMDATRDRARVLRVSTERHGSDAIAVTVQDSGPGIDPSKMDSIFDAFVTTKSQGMGLGLAICRMIIERHGGQLSASPARPYGSVFRVVLPTEKAGDA
jgi:signal transduction histidine kinase